MSLTFEQQSVWNRLQGEPGNMYSQAAEPEREAFRQMIKGVLQEGPVLVEFIKADGSARVMNCTLSEEHGAIYKMTETREPLPVEQAHRTPRVNNDICKVWDMDQKAWRSFRWDRLKRVEFSIG